MAQRKEMVLQELYQQDTHVIPGIAKNVALFPHVYSEAILVQMEEGEEEDDDVLAVVLAPAHTGFGM